MDRRVQAFELSSEDEVQNVLVRLEQAFDGRKLGAHKERRRYLDTFDWRIHRSGGWLSEMPGRKTTGLTWSANGHAPLLAQAPHPPMFAEDLPAGPLRKVLGRIVAPRRLMTVADVRRHEEALELLDIEGKVVCRAKVITNTIPSRTDPRSTTRLLLEGVRGYDEELAAVERFVRQEIGLPPTEAREIDEILARLEVQAGRDPSALKISLRPEMTASEALCRILAHLRHVLVINRKGVIDDLDTEFLHDFRVAVRRTRSVLGQVKQVLPAAAVEHFQKEFRWLGDLTGKARDLDVFLLNMPSYGKVLPADDAATMDALEVQLLEDRRQEQVKLKRALRGKRFERLLAEWRDFLADPTNGEQEPPPLADRTVSEVASSCTWKRYKKVRKIGRAIHDDTPTNELHSLRIQCKKLRYLFEVFRSLYPEQAMTRGIKELKRLQNTLGDFNDAEVHAGMLRVFAAELGQRKDGSHEPLVAIGILISHLLANRERERQKFFGSFAGFDTSENHARFKTLFAATSAPKKPPTKSTSAEPTSNKPNGRAV